MAAAKKVSKAKESKVNLAPAVAEQVVAEVEARLAAEPAPVVAPVRGLGIGVLVKELITQGLSTDEILAKVKEQIPSATTSRACVSWYRADMKKKAAKA